jgi:hypothetical protein
MGVSRIELQQHLWNGLWVECRIPFRSAVQTRLYFGSAWQKQNFPTVFSGITNFNKICATVYGTEGEVIFTNIRKQASDSKISQPLNPSSPLTNCFTPLT